MISLIRPPHYSDHVNKVPSIAKMYFITSLIRAPQYNDHAE